MQSDGLTTEAPLQLHSQLETVRGEVVTAFLGRLRPDRTSYRAKVPECAGGCRLDQIYLDRWSTPTPVRGELVVRSVEVDGRRIDAGLGTRGAWRPALALEGVPERAPAVTVAAADADGLRLKVRTQTDTQRVAVSTNDVPAVVPAIVTTRHRADSRESVAAARAYDPRPMSPRSVFFGSGFDGQTRPLQQVDTIPLLPRIGSDGVLVDLDSVARETENVLESVQLEVWMRSDTPAATLQALERQGAVLDQRTTIAERTAELETETGALTMNLYLLASVAGLLLAGAGSCVVLVIQAQRRRYEVAAARAVGVGRRTLRLAGIAEALVGLLPAVVLAVAAAALSGDLVLPSLPLPHSVDLGPPTFDWSWGVVAAVAGSASILLAATAWVSAHVMVRSADPDSVRGASL